MGIDDPKMNNPKMVKTNQAGKQNLAKTARPRKNPALAANNTFMLLLAAVIILSLLNVAQVKGLFILAQPEVKITEGTVALGSLTLEQKIAQMLIVHGNIDNLQAWRDLQLGGLHLFARESEDLFKEQIALFQKDLPIPFFITVDLEGCVNPFLNFRNFTAAIDIDNLNQAYLKGLEEGKFLKDIGVNLNFAPVVDLEDQIWNCRSFPGSELQISDLAQSYINGLQNFGILATIKHYPGKTLVVRDPHKFIVNAHIEKKDLTPYNFALKRGTVKAVMVSHIITDGAIDSDHLPSVVSRKVLTELKSQYPGLIISDEINMLGLKNFYRTIDEMYIAVFKAGNDLILNFNSDPNEINRMIKVVAAAAQSGEISIIEIDASVRKILEA